MQIHVDLSRKYNQKGDSVIGYKDRHSEYLQHALILKSSIKKTYEKKYHSIDKISNELHAIMIFLLLKDRDFSQAEEIIICCDYNYKRVYENLRILFSDDLSILNKLQSLTEYRRKAGKLKSYADSFVKKINKHNHKGMNIHRRHKILDNAHHVIKNDVDICLNYLLSKKEEYDKLCIEKQESLNISSLTIYEKTR